ncbi:MAG: hypothetical protein JWO92_1137 [Chitinophagaceae bacterium]|nr:hypothetical protein [Chitinophagaceae bacterium]
MQKKLPPHTNTVNQLEKLIPEFTEHLNNIRSLYTQLDMFVAILQRTDREEEIMEFLDFKKQLNFNGFLTVCMLDLLVTTKNLLLAKEIWEEIYYLRHGYLTIYETIITYTDQSKWIKGLVTTKYPGSKTKFDRLTDSIKHFKKEYSYEKTIAQTRNEITAHIEQDFLNYFQKISGFDISKATAALLSFISILNEMQNLSKDISIQIDKVVKERGKDLEVWIQNQMNLINKKFTELNKSVKLE